jgi:hypothetical protein
MREFKLLKLALLLTVVSLPCWVRPSLAQEEKAEKKAEEPFPKNTYHVEFTIRELDGNKQVNARHYLMNVSNREWGRLRSGSRVPVTLMTHGTTETQYQDVNMNIDCRPETVGEEVQLGIKVQSSSLANPEQVTSSPVFREQQLNVTTTVAPGKPTLIGSIDDVTSSHRFEIEVTATKVK